MWLGMFYGMTSFCCIENFVLIIVKDFVLLTKNKKDNSHPANMLTFYAIFTPPPFREQLKPKI